MKDEGKSKKQLIEELNQLRKKIAQLEELEIRHEQLDKTLMESNQKLLMMIEHLPGMGYSCRNDNQRTIEFISSGCYELTGYKPTDLIDNHKISFSDIIHPSDLPYVRDHIQEALANKQSWRLLYRVKTASGQEKWVWERGVGVFSNENHVINLQGFITDQSG